MDYSDCFSTWFDTSTKEVTQKEVKNIVKDYLIKSGKYDIWRKCKFAENSKRISLMFGTEFIKKYEVYLGAYQYLNSLEERCCRQVFESNKKKNQLLKRKLDYFLNNFDCVFLTLTFTDDVLNNTSHKTRRTYIQRFLKNLGSSFYVANIDYGDKDKNPQSNGREHYHALVNIGYVNLLDYKYGYIWAERVKKNSLPIKLSRYINKLTCHAYKDSTKGCDRLIYSRKSLMF